MPTASTSGSASLPGGLELVARAVEARVGELLDAETARWSCEDESLVAPLRALRDLVDAGGKRLRPAFCHWGWLAAGAADLAPEVVDAGAAFELLQAFALIHDDVMDGSAVRRGAPTVHRRFVEQHDRAGWAGESRRFGEGVAIVVGDLALVYADSLMPATSAEALALWHELRIEVNVGQYLDLAGTAVGGVDRVGARRIAILKSGRYTIERPLQLGALLAGGGDLVVPLGRYGAPLGEAFQLRDDVLGVFGEQERTGKPVGDDLREGKPTLMLAVASERADRVQAAVLERVGDPALDVDDVAALQRVLVDTGALSYVEGRIADLADEAIAALPSLPSEPSVRSGLADLAAFVVARST